MNLPNYQFIKNIKSLPFVEEVYLFGSRARGDNRSRSDIDLAISCPKATRNEWGKVQEIVENADTLLEIDCVRLEDTKPNFYSEISREWVKI
jgi:predicted nucleotidyltransferase